MMYCTNCNSKHFVLSFLCVDNGYGITYFLYSSPVYVCKHCIAMYVNTNHRPFIVIC